MSQANAPQADGGHGWARFWLVVWLTVLWMVLWRDFSLANLVTGTIGAFAVTGLYRMGRARVAQPQVQLGPLLSFVAYFIYQLVVANITVARVILSRRSKVNTGIIAVHLGEASDLATTMVANAITLTPGSMTIEVRDEPRRLYVHVLHVGDTETERRGVEEMARRGLRAFGYVLGEADRQ